MKLEFKSHCEERSDEVIPCFFKKIASAKKRLAMTKEIEIH